MAEVVIMPKMGITMTEGTLTNWKVKVGDKVETGDVLFEVETGKLTNEVEAEVEGTVRAIMVEEGTKVECLTPLAVIGDPDEDISGLV